MHYMMRASVVCITLLFFVCHLASTAIQVAASPIYAAPPETNKKPLPSPTLAWRTRTPLFAANARTFGDPLLIDSSPLTPRLVVYSSATDITNRSETQLHFIDVATGIPLRSLSVESGIGPYSGWCSANPLNPLLCYCGTDTGFVVVNTAAMEVVWQYQNDSWLSFGAPMHPTAIVSDNGEVLVFGVFENGVNGSSLFIMRPFASSGNEIVFEEFGTITYTLVWPVVSTNGVVYGRYHVNASTGEDSIEIVSRSAFSPFSEIFVRSGYTFAPPGLWNNPNLDVDAEGQTIIVYTKPRIGFRNIQQLDSRTGNILWELPTVGPVPDYDTYAFKNHFYRMITDPANPNTTTLIQSYNCTSQNPFQTVSFPTHDDNAIVLIGNQGGGYVFGLNTDIVFYQPLAKVGGEGASHSSFSYPLTRSLNINQQPWAFDVPGPSTGVTNANEDRLFFGSSNGYYFAVKQF